MGESSNNMERTKGWSRFWKLRVPVRVKLMTWRLFHNGLPVAGNLSKRGCVTELCCPFCGFKDENSKHVFIECWWAKCYWSSLEVTWPDSNAASVGDCLWYFFGQSDLDTLRKIVTGIWVLWRNKNLAVHENLLWSINQSYHKVINLNLQLKKKGSDRRWWL